MEEWRKNRLVSLANVGEKVVVAGCTGIVDNRGQGFND